MGKKILLTSAFQEINSWDKENGIQKFVPEGALILKSDNTDIVLLVEKIKTVKGEFTRVSLLDKIVGEISRKGVKKISKRDAINTAKILREQSKKLESLAETYKIMAIAIEADKDSFLDTVQDDQVIRKLLDNPF